ncbi:MAG: flagellar hook-length control protein FliK [Thalassococcus sp.]|uniref:flagellar hook-length control protein FliK n=1 Tax=Thalassococcus sp. TaxID=1928858 RepID=UPI001B0AE573|nr:flagellar hook-length control protein FliK [Thalassococcus sp.]MBO6866402.1 flagellar hook-length control protein FliK [Thalassococcus sp.]
MFIPNSIMATLGAVGRTGRPVDEGLENQGEDFLFVLNELMAVLPEEGSEPAEPGQDEAIPEFVIETDQDISDLVVETEIQNSEDALDDGRVDSEKIQKVTDQFVESDKLTESDLSNFYFEKFSTYPDMEIEKMSMEFNKENTGQLEIAGNISHSSNGMEIESIRTEKSVKTVAIGERNNLQNAASVVPKGTFQFSENEINKRQLDTNLEKLEAADRKQNIPTLISKSENQTVSPVVTSGSETQNFGVKPAKDIENATDSTPETSEREGHYSVLPKQQTFSSHLSAEARAVEIQPASLEQDFVPPSISIDPQLGVERTSGAVFKPSPSVAPQISARVVEAVPAATEGPVEIVLDPEELGKLRMQITRSETGWTLHVNIERPETLDFMRRHIETLQKDLVSVGYESLNLQLGGGQNGGASAQEHLKRAEGPSIAVDEAQAQNMTTVVINDGLDIRV